MTTEPETIRALRRPTSERADAGKHSERMLDFMIQHTNSLTRLFEILEQFTIERDRLRTENERLQADVSNLLQAIEGKDSALDRLRSFSPTAQHINALPESLRRYIHDIETRCDPAGDIRELTITKDENRMLRAEHEALRRRVEDCELALRVWDQGGESEYWVRHREGGV